MSAHRNFGLAKRPKLITNCAYVPSSATPMRDEFRREWRTARTIIRQMLRAPSREDYFLFAAVIAGAIVAGLAI